MRTVVMGLLLGVGLLISVVAIFSQRNHAVAQQPDVYRPQQRTASDQLIAFSVPATEGRQQITLIDPRLRVMSVYHVETATGQISLRSVRRFQWDLQMDEFNGVSPSPRDIRALLEQR